MENSLFLLTVSPFLSDLHLINFKIFIFLTSHRVRSSKLMVQGRRQFTPNFPTSRQGFFNISHLTIPAICIARHMLTTVFIKSTSRAQSQNFIWLTRPEVSSY